MNFGFKANLSCFILFLSCGNGSPGAGASGTNLPTESTVQTATKHVYPDSMSCPAFFKALIQVHADWFLNHHRTEYSEMCSLFKLDENDSVNKQVFASVRIIHEMLSSRSAANCSKGEILDIPYFWHWVSPNPRHAIRFVSDGKLLSETKPAEGFGKYRSYADIDRTPLLFISDILSGKKKYYMDGCDSFSGFGWCSEREMAAVALLHILGLKGKVVAENNHSWSEYILFLNTTAGTTVPVRLKMDNTFYELSWHQISKADIARWQTEMGKSTLSKWYNSKANSETELAKIRKLIVRAELSADIEDRMMDYRRKIKD